MSKKLYEESNIQNIASAIREKNGTQNQYTVAQMGNAVRAIETQPDLETLTVTENGNYLPSSGKDGFSEVSVNVPASSDPVLQEKLVTSNGIVTPDSGYDGLSKVTVNVNEVLPTRMYIVNPDTLDAIYVGEGNHNNQKRTTLPLAGFCGYPNGSIDSSYYDSRVVVPILTKTDRGNGNKVFISRNGYYSAAYVFYNSKIPANVYSKLYIEIEVTNGYASTNRNCTIGLTKNQIAVNESSFGNVLKLVKLSAENTSDAAIMSQTGVVIQNVSNHNVPLQTIEIDITDIHESFYVGIQDCDRKYYLRSMYVE